MKELPHSRRKRPPNNQSPKKFKLVCSYNGSFQCRSPSGKLRYVGGETRIVSVDRNIGFLRFRSNILDLSPNITSFCLRYQLPESDTPLVLIATDDDVRCMIEEYDRLELYCKHSRLWLYVCSNEYDYSNALCGNHVRRVSCAKGVNWFESAYDSRECETLLSGFAQGDGDNVGKDYGVRNDDKSLRNIVQKQQLLAKQSALIHGESQKHDNPLVDLDPDSQVPKKFEGGQCTNAFDNEIACIHMSLSDDSRNSIQCTKSHSHPLNPRDENLRVEANGSAQSVVGRCGQVFFNGSQCLKQLNSSSMEPVTRNFDAKHDQQKIGMVKMGSLNRENIMPLAKGCESIKIHVSSQSREDNMAASDCYDKSLLTCNRVCTGSQSSIRNHSFGVHNARNQRFGPYNVRNNRSNMTDMGNHQAFRLYGRLPTGKCYPGLGPHSSIAKQGQSIRVNSSKFGSAFPQHVLGGKINIMGSSSSKSIFLFEAPFLDEKLRQQRNTAFSVACNGLATQNFFRDPFVRTMDNETGLLTGSYYEKSKVTCETLYDNSNEVQVNFAPICYNHNEQLEVNPYEVAKTPGFRYDMARAHSVGLRFGGKNRNGSKLQDLPKRDATSINISFCNLSLSSSQDVKPQNKPIDLMDEGQFIQRAKFDKLNGDASSHSLQNAAKMDGEELYKEAVNRTSLSGLSIDEKVKDKESRKSSNVIDRISSDLASFYTHLATRELQTIKNSDLEYIKALGSGTYGTVFCGKWKGSDVAIKKIKPSCFTVGTREEDRLIADFWKEAHILGQLHHPNIVAFYGVVRDGPVTNLATVTEYMVNGSLQQVLHRKDRTIDRRKRLIIAMDAAFGMEYLHDKGIVHFDLKSHNFLVNMRDPQRPICKIGDLGLSKIKQKTLVSGGVRGTVPWMAPELLSSKDNLVTEKIDVYSFGIVMWELLTGEEPYEKMRPEEIIAGIIRGNIRPEIPSWCDPLWRSLMERCWSSDPYSRPSFSEIAKELRIMSAAMNIK